MASSLSSRTFKVLLWLFESIFLPFLRKPLRSALKLIDSQKIVLGMLKHAKTGSLTIQLPNQPPLHFGAPRSGSSEAADPDAAVVVVLNPTNFFWRCLTAEDIGFAESFIEGEWTTPNLTNIIAFFARNRVNQARTPPLLSLLPFTVSDVGTLLNYLHHASRPNDVGTSRRNISEHYDLSNELFALFLDKSMMYSSAVFSEADLRTGDLHSAQMRKLHMIIDKARLKAGDHLLEIGSGWGSLAIEAVKRTGCRVTTVTLSVEQKAWADRRIREEGLSDRIEVVLIDYRLISGKYDAIISIEMLEAVGHDFFGEYFAALDRLLKPNGVCVIQVIAIPDGRYENYRKTCDFIQKHIFPGGLLPSLTVLCENMTKHSSLAVDAVENYPQHYAHTLRLWRDAFLKNTAQIKALGFDDRFIRKWDYYFCYCEAGFITRTINLLQLVLTREANEERLPIALAH